MLESPTIFSTSAPLKQTTLSAQSYVLSLASLPSLYAASASSPSNVIDLFDKSTLQGVQTLSGHGVATTSLKAVDTIANLSRTSLVTSGKDGLVNVWDERSNTVSIKSKPGFSLVAWIWQVLTAQIKNACFSSDHLW